MRYRDFILGFSLIELMVVLTILSMVAGIAVPSLSNWLKNNQIDAIVLQTYGLLNAARSEAISRGETARIEFDADSGSLMTCIVSDNSKTCGDAIEEAPVERMNWDAEKITIGSSGAINNGIMFDRRGRVTPRQTGVSLSYCDDRGSDYGFVLTLDQIGRTNVSKLSADTEAQCP